ncbi:MAG: hypothetical protein PHV16_03965 [Candidatus Nanoarchaeia archaeon]|nr:hypothetical protein [Candidatus Nanoarchaeia archaeon]
MSKITPEQLLNHKGIKDVVKGSVYNSISYGIIQIAESAVKSEEIMREIGTSLDKIVNLYRNSDLILKEMKKTVPELKRFWDDVASIANYQFEKIDEVMLSKDARFPTELIYQINKNSSIYGKEELYGKLIKPLEEKINTIMNEK